MDDKDFWSDLAKAGTDPQAKIDGAGADITLDPGYRAEDKPTTTDPPSERSFDIDTIIADILKGTDRSVRSPVSKPQPPVADEPFADGTTVDDPPAGETPDAELDDHELMRKMFTTVQELTAEVKQLRSQVGAKPNDVASYPSERLLSIAKNVDSSTSDSQSFQLSEPVTYTEYVLVSPTEETEKPLAEEDLSENNTRRKPQTKKKGKGSVLSDILFYITIAIVIVCGTMYGGLSSGAPKSFAGYSVFTVLTSSMQREIPKDSLVITKVTEPSELRVGDDITYLVNPTTTVTHRIVGIVENYENTGQRAFQTKGIMNDVADKDPVPAANVVGRVIYHNHTLGKIATFVTDNIVPLIIFLVLFIIFFAVFKKVLQKKQR